MRASPRPAPSSSRSRARARRTPASLTSSATRSRPEIQAALMLAAAGPVAILLAFLPDAVEVGGAAAILVAALITAGERGGKPGAVLDWWNLLAAGAFLAGAGGARSLAVGAPR